MTSTKIKGVELIGSSRTTKPKIYTPIKSAYKNLSNPRMSTFRITLNAWLLDTGHQTEIVQSGFSRPSYITTGTTLPGRSLTSWAELQMCCILHQAIGSRDEGWRAKHAIM